MTKVTTTGPNIKGLELTTKGMQEIFARMGHPDISTGSILNGVVTADIEKLNTQGFMPVLTSVDTAADSGHWMMLIKGENDEYYLFDPLGEESARNYYEALENHLYVRYNLSIIPTPPDLSMGLCGYWVASAGLRACKALNPERTVANLEAVGQTIATDMQNELANDGYQNIKKWLLSVAHGFHGEPATDPQPDATALRYKFEKDKPAPIPPAKQITAQPENDGMPDWQDYSLYTDPIVKHAIQHAHDKYLGTPYVKGRKESEPGYAGGIIIYRQHHGLAHTLRTMAYSEVIVDEARKATQRGEVIGTFPDGRTLADVTPNDLKKILIAQAFFVAGREGEESDTKFYEKYHKLSRKAFLDYIEENKATLIPDVFKDQDEIDHYADIVEDVESVDGKKLWGASPEHMLVNQSHMVDLVRVKQPPESYLVDFYNALYKWVGKKGTDAVFAIQREFFHATYENVTAFDSNSKEPHLVGGYGRYLMINDKPVRESTGWNAKQTGALKVYSDKHILKENERFMRVDEYLKELGTEFPGNGKMLEGGFPGLNIMQNEARVNSKERGLCETNVDYCLAQLAEASRKAKLASIKTAVQSSPTAERRKANPDEIAAAAIIKQILADPTVIHEDHVQLKDQRLEEQFFRTLLAKCDMAVIGSLLETTDVSNIDQLMEHEKNTLFHSTDEPVSSRPIGEMWENVYRKNGTNPVQFALVNMMQDGSWYYTRLNAIAQGRDTGSSFKEVLLTTLLIPATTNGIAATQPRGRIEKKPQRLYRGMFLADDLVDKIFKQSESIIANSSLGLFSDSSAEIYKQVQINGFSKMLANTCLSTSGEVSAGGMFGNVVADIDDPEGLLLPKHVGIHTAGSETEYSVYLPDDVALVPVQVIKASAGNPHIIRLVAVKSPDFIPRVESGYAVTPFIEIQSARMAELIQTFNKQISPAEIGNKIAQLKSKVSYQSKLHVRELWDKFTHSLSFNDDGKISAERKEFLDSVVFPLLQECQIAFRTGRMDLLKTAFTKFPTDKQWAPFKSEEAVSLKAEMDEIKREIEIKISAETLNNTIEEQDFDHVLDSKITILMAKVTTQAAKPVRGFWDKLVHHFILTDDGKISAEEKEFLDADVLTLLADCQDALSTGDLNLLKFLVAKFPTKDQWKKFKSEETIKLKAEMDEIKQDIELKIFVEELIYPALNKCKDELDNKNVSEALKALQDLPKDTAWPQSKQNDALKKVLNHVKGDLQTNLANLQQAPSTPAMSDKEKIQKRYEPLLSSTIKDMDELEKLTFVEDISSYVKAAEKAEMMFKEVELLRTEKTRIGSDPDTAIDFSDVEQLEEKLQKFTQNLVDSMCGYTRESIEIMTDPKTFHTNEPIVAQCLKTLSTLQTIVTDTKQKDEVAELKSLFAAKQKDYPLVVQLQFKNEALMIQLRQLCINQQNKINAQKNQPSKGGITSYITGALFALRIDLYLDARFEAQQLAKFKLLLTSGLDVAKMIHKLAKRDSAELQKVLGISEECADDLEELLYKLNTYPADEAELKEQLEWVDSISAKLRKEPLAPVIQEIIENDVDEEDVEEDIDQTFHIF